MGVMRLAKGEAASVDGVFGPFVLLHVIAREGERLQAQEVMVGTYPECSVMEEFLLFGLSPVGTLEPEERRGGTLMVTLEAWAAAQLRPGVRGVTRVDAPEWVERERANDRSKARDVSAQRLEAMARG